MSAVYFEIYGITWQGFENLASIIIQKITIVWGFLQLFRGPSHRERVSECQPWWNFTTFLHLNSQISLLYNCGHSERLQKHVQTVYNIRQTRGPWPPLSFLNNVFGFFFSPLHFLFMPGLFWGPLGVWGLLIPWYWYFAFFSLGFRIWKTSGQREGCWALNYKQSFLTWKEHMSVSSTDIIPPALSNSPQ